jgi:hypothetical protein
VARGAPASSRHGCDRRGRSEIADELRAVLAASGWRLDIKGADVRESLARANVPCLLLKGRAFAALLYADGTPRPYSDCDLLIPASLRERAASVLSDLGFTAQNADRHARAWLRPGDGLWLDLHHTLPLVGTDPEHLWDTLWPRASSLQAGGMETKVLDPAASALLAALHVVHHGPDAPAPRRDLERAIDQLGDDCWRNAADLARQLKAEGSLGTGLRLVPAGVEIANRLGLGWAPSRPTLLNWHRAPWGATVWEALAGAPTVRERASVIRAFLVPPPSFLRERSALARRGRRGLLAAYLMRPLLLTFKAVRSLGPWRRARRDPGAPSVS